MCDNTCAPKHRIRDTGARQATLHTINDTLDRILGLADVLLYLAFGFLSGTLGAQLVVAGCFADVFLTLPATSLAVPAILSDVLPMLLLPS